MTLSSRPQSVVGSADIGGNCAPAQDDEDWRRGESPASCMVGSATVARSHQIRARVTMTGSSRVLCIGQCPSTYPDQ